MALLRLPLDILDNIVQTTLPEGFEALMTTCKVLHRVGNRYLDEYNRLSQAWKHIDTTSQFSEVGDVADLLLRVTDNTVVARYIVEARLWTGTYFGSAHSETPHKDRLDQLWEYQCTKMGVNAVDLKPLERCQMPDYQRREQIEAQRCVRSTIILLTMLSNIRILDLPRQWKWCKPPSHKHDTGRNAEQLDIWRVMDQLVSASNENASTRALPRLKRLSYVEPAGYDLGDSSLGFRCLTPFLAMPQITELYASSLRLVDDGYTGIQFGDWRYPKYESNLQKVELANCCMDASIEKFLSHVPKLKVFSYSHECKWHGCQYEWSAGEFVAAVGKCCGGSLMDLAVTIDDRSIGSIMTGVTSLQEFVKLQHLELDTRVFMGPSIHSGERVDHTDKPENIKWKLEQIPSLTQMLPASLQSLMLRSSIDIRIGEVFKQLLEGFVTNTANKLPSLHRVVHEQEWDFGVSKKLQMEEVSKACESNGIECRFSQSVHAPWRRGFAQRFPRIEQECDACR